jgi:hypothetical protein|tara:strand:+ start:2559 stop:2783 length:225 start_codon:yes stop_codon:yes gene_type:complete
MSYLNFIKKAKISDGERWVVKYNKQGLVREVKQIFKPSEYYAMNKHKGEKARPLHKKSALIGLLEANSIKLKGE